MPIQKTEAVVLKSIKLGETSKIVTTYTRQFGIEKLVAKGSRGAKSRYCGSLEPLNFVNMLFYLKPNRDLQFLSEVDIIQAFSSIRKDLKKTAYALAICEILVKTQLPGEPNQKLFENTTQALNAIDATSYSPFTVFLAFQFKFLDLAGFSPNITSCRICHRQVLDETVVFDPANGGFFCSDCSGDGIGISLSGKVLRFFNWLRKSSLTEVARYDIPNEILLDAEKVLTAYTNFHLEDLGRLKSLDFLLQVQ